MKKFVVLVIAAASLMAAPAVARDRVPPVFNWSGSYVGIDAGYLRGDQVNDLLLGFMPAVETSPSGFTGGAHIGYRWQAPLSRFVYGVEADIWDTSAKETRNYPGFANQAIVEVNWGGSLRGVLGIAMNSSLLYVTGGVTFADIEGCSNTGAGSTCGSSYSDTRIGYILGLGVAHALSPRATIRLEYLYADYGSKIYATDNLVGTRNETDLQTHTFRAGLSWRFAH